MTYVLPEYLNWLGWVGAALIILTTVYLFYRQRKKKDTDPRTMWMHGIDGFASVWIPNEVEKPAGIKMANQLSNIKRVVWKQCARAYKDPGSQPWTVAQINMAHAYPSKDHPEIVWFPAAHKIRIRIQKSMSYWFAHECHNVYRWQLHGPKWVYSLRNAEDRAAALFIQNWIDQKWSKNNG